MNVPSPAVTETWEQLRNLLPKDPLFQRELKNDDDFIETIANAGRRRTRPRTTSAMAEPTKGGGRPTTRIFQELWGLFPTAARGSNTPVSPEEFRREMDEMIDREGREPPRGGIRMHPRARTCDHSPETSSDAMGNLLAHRCLPDIHGGRAVRGPGHEQQRRRLHTPARSRLHPPTTSR